MAQQSSRRYVKRIWRVPADRGALEFFATLVIKAMVKHGWPAKWERVQFTDGFELLAVGHDDVPTDMVEAFEIACRIVARTYRIDIEQHGTWAGLAREYVVTPRRDFREVKYD